jgi:hypothetical protein
LKGVVDQFALDAGAVAEREFRAEVAGDPAAFGRQLERRAFDGDAGDSLVGGFAQAFEGHLVPLGDGAVGQLEIDVHVGPGASEEADFGFAQVDVDGRDFVEIDFVFWMVAVEHTAIGEAGPPSG